MTQQSDERRETIRLSVAGYQQVHGRPPTIREVAAATGICPSMTNYHLEQLARFGELDRLPGRRQFTMPAERDIPIPDDAPLREWCTRTWRAADGRIFYEYGDGED